MTDVIAEEATGIHENIGGGGPFWIPGASSGCKVTDKQAQIHFDEGGIIHAPNAGAGSYRSVLERLGCTDVELVDSTSSAGDWFFKAELNGKPIRIWQNNRYPYHGFSYNQEGV